MRLLHGRQIVLGDAFSARHAGTGRAAGPRDAFGSHLPVHGICVDRCRGARSRSSHRQRVVTMDLGSAFAAAVMRQPRQEAFVEGNRRMTLYWACHLLGIVFTPVSWRATAGEIGYCLEDAEAAAVAFDGASGPAAAEAAATLKIDPRRVIVAADGKGEGTPFARLRDSHAVAGPTAVGESSRCLMLYTSGTTGRPKGVPRSHRSELMA